MRNLTLKIKRKLWHKVIVITRGTSIYPYLYKSYWNHLFFARDKQADKIIYMTARPNKGAGIGHQLANWISGYWWANQFDVEFAHSPFSSEKWEFFLGLGAGEKSVEELIKSGYKTRIIPLFDENKPAEVDLIKKIVESYKGSKTLLLCEQDQFYKDQYGVMDTLRKKFYSGTARQNDQLIFSSNYWNIAVHVRRGDIMEGQKNGIKNHTMRWQHSNYFINVLSNTIKIVDQTKPIRIYLFSQGSEADFTDFLVFDNLKLCLDMNAESSFLHMVYADYLITSKSSFSYKPALLNRGIKVCPKNFWHSYPESQDWILADSEGRLVSKPVAQ